MPVFLPERIERWTTDSIKPYERNPRTHTEAQIAMIARSIEEFGFTNPILVDEDHGIIAGHGRLLAAVSLGMGEVPVIKLAHLTLEQRKAYVIADNQLAQQAGWDRDLLGQELLDLGEHDFDLSLLGFDVDELGDLLEDARGGGGGGDPGPIEPPEKPVSKTGDVWICGGHRIRCGDSTVEEDVLDLMAGALANQLLTDPPYGVSYGEKSRQLLKHKKGPDHKNIANDDIEDLPEFFYQFLQHVRLKERNTAHIFMAGTSLQALHEAVLRAGLTFSQYLIWVKNNHVLGRSDYDYKHEFILYGWKGKHKFYGPHRTTVLEYDRPHAAKLHPTMKPEALLRQLVTDGSPRRGIVYDAFLGSGSTVMACEAEGRRCFGMELDPGYVDVAVKRWQEGTGQQARLEETGEPFPENIVDTV